VWHCRCHTPRANATKASRCSEQRGAPPRSGQFATSTLALLILLRCSCCTRSRRACNMLSALSRLKLPRCWPQYHRLWPQLGRRRSVHKTAVRSVRSGRQRSLPASARCQPSTDQTLAYSKGLQHRWRLRSSRTSRVSKMFGTAIAVCTVLCPISVQRKAASNMQRPG
jgi:hypothetical protein